MNPDLLFSAKIVRLEVIEEEPQTRDCGKTAQPCKQKREKNWERIIVPILWHFGKLNFTYLGNLQCPSRCLLWRPFLLWQATPSYTPAPYSYSPIDSIFPYENFGRNLDCDLSLSLICACSLSLSLLLTLSLSLPIVAGSPITCN